MNARLEAASEAFWNYDDPFLRWDQIAESTRAITRDRVALALAAADAHDATETGWRAGTESAVYSDPSDAAYYGFGDPRPVKRRVGPWVAVTEGNDQ